MEPFSVVLNALTKAPFELMKDTDLKMRGPTANLLSYYLFYIFIWKNTVFLLNSLPYF